VAGVTVIETNVAAVTVRVVEPLIVPDVAVTVVVPCATQVARPVVLFTVATKGLDDFHVEEPVKFLVVPLL
jgi:hypothetical protein